MNLKTEKHTRRNPRTPTREFAEYVLEVFRLFGEIKVHRMFSGYGLFRDGLMFGLVYDQTVYLKADADSIAEFQNKGLGQFQYERGGKVRVLSYFRPPDLVMDDPGEAARWARLAFEATLRGAAVKKSRRRTRRRIRPAGG